MIKFESDDTSRNTKHYPEMRIKLSFDNHLQELEIGTYEVIKPLTTFFTENDIPYEIRMKSGTLGIEILIIKHVIELILQHKDVILKSLPWITKFPEVFKAIKERLAKNKNKVTVTVNEVMQDMLAVGEYLKQFDRKLVEYKKRIVGNSIEVDMTDDQGKKYHMVITSEGEVTFH